MNPLASKLTFLFSWFILHSFSQDYSPFNITLSATPRSQVDESSGITAKVGLNYPFIRNSKTTFLTGFSYGLYHYKIQSDTLTLSNIFSITFPLVYVYKLSDKYKILTSYEVGIGSDMVEFSHHDDFKHILNLCLIKARNDTTKWIANLQLYQHHGGLSISPNLFINARIFGKLYFNGVLPFKPKISWKINDKYQLGATITTDKNSFMLYEEITRKYIEETQCDFDLFYQYCLSRNFKISASLGYTFLHNLKIFDDDERVPIKVYIFDGTNKKSIQSNPKSFNFKVRLFWSLNN